MQIYNVNYATSKNKLLKHATCCKEVSKKLCVLKINKWNLALLSYWNLSLWHQHGPTDQEIHIQHPKSPESQMWDQVLGSSQSTQFVYWHSQRILASKNILDCEKDWHYLDGIIATTHRDELLRYKQKTQLDHIPSRETALNTTKMWHNMKYQRYHPRRLFCDILEHDNLRQFTIWAFLLIPTCFHLRYM